MKPIFAHDHIDALDLQVCAVIPPRYLLHRRLSVSCPSNSAPTVLAD